MNVLPIGGMALVAAGQAAQVRANNIVNAQTAGFKPMTPVYSPIVSGGGVAVFTQSVDRPVNLINETLGLMSAAQQYRAAASLMRRADDIASAFLEAIA